MKIKLCHKIMLYVYIYIYINMGLYLATYSQLLWYYGYIMLMYPIRTNELNNTRVSCQVCSIDYDNPHQLWGSGTPFVMIIPMWKR